jgi:uncharacterized protein YndB with AHSA1/START domain
MNVSEIAGEFPPERTIRSMRTFPFAVDRIWRAFRDPAALATWWGPAGFTNDFEEFDFRVGGTWKFTMRGPDGSGYPMHKTFVNIDPAARIVLDHPDPVHGFRMHMDFKKITERVAGNTGENRPEKTEIRWAMVFDHADEAAKVRPFVEPANEQNFDRLADYLSNVRD